MIRGQHHWSRTMNVTTASGSGIMFAKCSSFELGRDVRTLTMSAVRNLASDASSTRVCNKGGREVSRSRLTSAHSRTGVSTSKDDIISLRQA